MRKVTDWVQLVIGLLIIGSFIFLVVSCTTTVVLGVKSGDLNKPYVETEWFARDLKVDPKYIHHVERASAGSYEAICTKKPELNVYVCPNGAVFAKNVEASIFGPEIVWYKIADKLEAK